MQPVTRYTKVGNDYVAYQVVGEGPRDLVYVAGLTSQIDLRWDFPPMADFLNRLARFNRLILFDRRGFGASDPVPSGVLTWEEWADDLRAVLAAVGSDSAVLFAESDAAPTALLLAAASPELVSALIVANGGAKYVAGDGFAGVPPDTAEQLALLIESSWGTESLVQLALPSLAHDEARMAQVARQLRACTTPGRAAAQFRYLFELDVREVVGSIRVPTLVIQRDDDPFTTKGMGQDLASRIDGARHLEVPGSDFWCCTEGADEILAAIEEFLTGSRPQVDVDRVLATVMFTDIVDSTRLAADLGDRSWKSLLDRHDQVTRTAIESLAGRVVKTTGDGALAVFDSPGRAVTCAVDLSERLASSGISIRVGLHTGEVERRADDVGGIAVHIAARVMATAGPGEILSSRTVRDLVIGSIHRFEDRGEFELKGVPESWRLFQVAT